MVKYTHVTPQSNTDDSVKISTTHAVPTALSGQTDTQILVRFCLPNIRPSLKNVGFRLLNLGQLSSFCQRINMNKNAFYLSPQSKKEKKTLPKAQ